MIAFAEKPTGRVPALDLLRLFAALTVVLYHYTFHGPGAYDLTWLSFPSIAWLTRYFYLGVPLFFVISGFAIAYSAEGRTVREFVVARVARIYPGFLICMTLTFLVVAAFGEPRLHTSLTQWAANLIIAAPALKQPYMDMVYWSIVCEGVFYALVAAMIAVGLFATRLPALVAAWLIVSTANELLLDSVWVRHALITNYSGFFASGLMLYAIHRGRRTATTWGLLAAATVVGALQANWNADWLRERAVEISPVVVIAISVGAVGLVGLCLLVKRVPVRAGALIALGGLTYPLYLLHQMIGYSILNRLEGVASPVVLLMGLVVAMLILSWTVYRFGERPAQKVAKSVLSRLMASRLWLSPLPREARREAGGNA
jgi:peptidoglycan/LPS O-acetylase OafA/YrhL